MSDAAGTFTIPEQVRGICTVCGAKAYHHMSTKCDEHREVRDGAAQPMTPPRVVVDDTDGPRIRVERPAPSPPPRPQPNRDKKDADKAARAAELETSILRDLNPVLLQGFAMICKPIDPANFFTLDGGELVVTPIGQQVIITEGEAKILAKAAAELEASPVGTMATAAVGPVLPILYAVAAVGVVGFHGYKVMQIRTELLTQYNAQMQAQAANVAGAAAASAARGPVVSEGIADEFYHEPDVRGWGTTTPPNGQEPNMDFTAA